HCPPAMPTTLAEEQRQVLIRLLSSRDFITLFQGGAGTGKSFVLKTVVESLNEAGHLVITLTPQRQQAVDLAAKGFSAPRAVADAAVGNPAKSFAGLEQLGAIVACPFGDQTERLAEEYLFHVEAGHSLVVVAQTWQEVNAVNKSVRARLREKGLLGENETEV